MVSPEMGLRHVRDLGRAQVQVPLGWDQTMYPRPRQDDASCAQPAMLQCCLDPVSEKKRAEQAAASFSELEQQEQEGHRGRRPGAAAQRSSF